MLADCLRKTDGKKIMQANDTDNRSAGSLQDQWISTLNDVLQFKADHGKLPGDGGLAERERNLQQWLKRQKTAEAAGNLSPAQIQALNAVDGDWRANQSHLSWENNLTAAVLGFQRLGRLPGSTEESGRWLGRQRSRLSAGKLSSDQLAALDRALPGWRNLDRVRWFQQLESLISWCSASRKLPTSRTTDPEGQRLGVWLGFQRKRNRAGLLADERVKALDAALPGWRGRNG